MYVVAQLAMITGGKYMDSIGGVDFWIFFGFLISFN
jgi:hypothetical protein